MKPYQNTFTRYKQLVDWYTKGDFPVDECTPWWGGQDGKNYGILGKGKKIYKAHRLILSWKLDRELSSEEHCMHSCDNPICINPNHLSIGTNQENTSDKVNKGRQAKGENHPRATLTEADVVEIRRLFYSKEKTAKELQLMYTKSQGRMHEILTGKSWKHVPMPDNAARKKAA